MSNSKVRPVWAVGPNLEAVRKLKTLHLMHMSEEEYERLIKSLEDEYKQAAKIARSYYP